MLRTSSSKIAALGLVVLAAGCSNSTRDRYYAAKDRYTAEKARWSPVYVPSRSSRESDAGVKWSQLTYVAEFQPKSAKLTSKARHALSKLGSRHGRRGARVTVLLDYPADSKAKKLVEKRRRAISFELARHGLSASNVRAVPGAKHKDAAVVLIGVRTAMISSCKEWQTSLSGRLPQLEEWRYGCVTRSSLRAHIDNPSDLVSGRRLDDLDGVVGAKSIEDYRAGKMDTLPESEGTTGGDSQ